MYADNFIDSMKAILLALFMVAVVVPLLTVITYMAMDFWIDLLLV